MVVERRVNGETNYLRNGAGRARVVRWRYVIHARRAHTWAPCAHEESASFRPNFRMVALPLRVCVQARRGRVSVGLLASRAWWVSCLSFLVARA